MRPSSTAKATAIAASEEAEGKSGDGDVTETPPSKQESKKEEEGEEKGDEVASNNVSSTQHGRADDRRGGEAVGSAVGARWLLEAHAAGLAAEVSTICGLLVTCSAPREN